MITTEFFNATIDFFAALLMLVMFVGCIIVYNKSSRNIRAMLELLATVFLMVTTTGLTFVFTPDNSPKLHYFLETLFTFFLYGAMLHMTLYILMVIKDIDGDGASKKIYKVIKKVNTFICIIACIASFIMSRFQRFIVTDSNGVEFNLAPYILSVVFLWISAGLNLALVISARKTLKMTNVIVFSFCIILPLLADFVNPIELMPSSRPLMIVLAMVILYVVQYVGRNLMFHKNEAEVSKMRTQMLISVVQPHFIYNVLNSIYYMAGKDPELTKKSISAFSDYLRGNMDYMNYDKAILFEDEITHLKTYFELMELRYGDKVRLEFDLHEIDFNIPAMTLQPLVENSIKYGVGSVKGVLTVIIRTRNEDGHIVVIVEDNGPGYHPETNKDDKSTHSGIANVCARVKIISGGTVTIENNDPEGTSVKIRL